MSLVEIKDVKVRYGAVEALKAVSLTLDSGEFIAILGPSGCGKTTSLRAIAGFVPHEGTISVDGRVYNDVPPHKRDIGIVFQDYALFPHQTVSENVAFGPRLRRLPAESVKRRTDDLLRLLHLHGLGSRYPGNLSGGQRQRVALARALAIEPRLLLLDEPLSALDRKLREEMQVELRQLQRRVGITSLIVTHDQEEALALADRIVVMSHGEIRQVGTPAEIYDRPRDRFVADFVGKSNIFDARATGQDGNDLVGVASDNVVIRIAEANLAPGSAFHFLVRPERLSLREATTNAASPNHVSGRVDHVLYLGARQQIRVAIAEHWMILVDTPNSTRWKIGEAVTVSWKPTDAIIIDA